LRAVYIHCAPYRNPRSGFRLFRAGPTPWVMLIFGVRGNSNTPNPSGPNEVNWGDLDSPANLFHGRQSPAKTESANRFFAPQIVASPLVKRSPRILTAHHGSRYGQDDNDRYDTLANGILAHSDRGPAAQCVADQVEQVVDSLQSNRVGVRTFNFGQIVFDSGLLAAQLRDARTVCDSRRLRLGLQRSRHALHAHSIPQSAPMVHICCTHGASSRATTPTSGPSSSVQEIGR